MITCPMVFYQKIGTKKKIKLDKKSGPAWIREHSCYSYFVNLPCSLIVDFQFAIKGSFF